MARSWWTEKIGPRANLYRLVYVFSEWVCLIALTAMVAPAWFILNQGPSSPWWIYLSCIALLVIASLLINIMAGIAASRQTLAFLGSARVAGRRCPVRFLVRRRNFESWLATLPRM